MKGRTVPEVPALPPAERFHPAPNAGSRAEHRRVRAELRGKVRPVAMSFKQAMQQRVKPETAKDGAA